MASAAVPARDSSLWFLVGRCAMSAAGSSSDVRLDNAAPMGASPCEVGDGAAAPCAGEAPGLTEVEGEILTEESPCKKPRATSPGRIALTSPRRSPRAPEAGEVTSDSTSSRFGQRAQPLDEPRKCGGCRREYGVSPCYVDRNKIVQWAFAGGRGGWCLDCYKLWRAKYHEEHHLAFFKDWLDSEPRNRLEFSLLLGRYIDIRVHRSAPARLEG